MKKHTILSILLLISISFSMLNTFVIDVNETDHCSVQEYVQEFSQSNECGDLCDLRHMFHISFILPLDSFQTTELDNRITPPLYAKQEWISEYTFSTFRPPISA